MERAVSDWHERALLLALRTERERLGPECSFLFCPEDHSRWAVVLWQPPGEIERRRSIERFDVEGISTGYVVDMRRLVREAWEFLFRTRPVQGREAALAARFLYPNIVGDGGLLHHPWVVNRAAVAELQDELDRGWNERPALVERARVTVASEQARAASRAALIDLDDAMSAIRRERPPGELQRTAPVRWLGNDTQQRGALLEYDDAPGAPAPAQDDTAERFALLEME